LAAVGWGEVYRPRDTKLHRDVAIKLLPAEVALDPDRVARFLPLGRSAQAGDVSRDGGESRLSSDT
jgi:hypothetical protein